MNREDIERLQSISTMAGEIQRWAMQMACQQRISADRKHDIDHASERIAGLSLKLGKDS